PLSPCSFPTRRSSDLDFLKRVPENSVDVIFSAQFIEHVPSDRLVELLQLGHSRLRAQGLFIAETVNPESHLALKTFFVDLTHQRDRKSTRLNSSHVAI